MRGDVFAQQRLAHDHFRRRPGEHASAEIDDCGKALDPAQDEGRPPDHDGHADEQAEDDEQIAAVGSARHREHVVQPHDRVGHDDRSHRTPERGRTGAVMPLVAGVLGEQPVRDPDERGAADQQQTGDLEQPDDHDGHRAAYDDRADGPPQHGAALQLAWQAARRERDHDGVVAREHEIDDDDREQCGQERGREDVHCGFLVRDHSLRRHPARKVANSNRLHHVSRWGAVAIRRADGRRPNRRPSVITVSCGGSPLVIASRSGYSGVVLRSRNRKAGVAPSPDGLAASSSIRALPRRHGSEGGHLIASGESDLCPNR